MNTLMLNDSLIPLGNMFRNLEAIMDFDFNKESGGLKRWIKRPHNLITKKDKDGKIESYQLEMVYTPFKKNDVKVEILDGTLTVKCGSENKIKDEDMDYCGISHQSYSFSIPLSDSIDIGAIDAKAEDGVLRIGLPVKKIEDKKPLSISVEVK